MTFDPKQDAFSGYLDSNGSTLQWIHGFFDSKQADTWLKILLEAKDWNQGEVIVRGHRYKENRLTFAVGAGDNLAYSGREVTSIPWENYPCVLDMKKHVGEFCGTEFTTALLNLYRDGTECLGYHSDKVSAGGGESLIASISLGASRDFAIKPLAGACNAVVTKPVNIPLHNGSLLIMSGSMQEFWQHSVPKRKSCKEPRINITFRMVPTKRRKSC